MGSSFKDSLTFNKVYTFAESIFSVEKNFICSDIYYTFNKNQI